MATYAGDCPKLLCESLESVEQQTLLPYEVIIVEAGPLTESQEKVISNKAEKLRIQRISQTKNRGLGAALAKGLTNASSTWVARLDADDVAFKDRLQRQAEKLTENPETDILGGAAVEIDSAGNTGRVRTMPLTHKEIAKKIWACPIIHPSVIFRSDKILEIGNYNQNLPRGQDYDLWFRALHNGLKFANTAEPVIYYRFSRDNIRRQPPRECFKQGVIGWHGCRQLRLPAWQHIAVWYPFFRSLLPLPIAEAAYRVSQRIDPRFSHTTKEVHKD